MRKALSLCFLICAGLSAQQIPPPTDLPSQPFFIKQTWYIGGSGSWDSVTMDPSAGLLYIAHGSQVQVVDVHSGSLAGSITGFQEARSIALDDTGQVGYVSDGEAGEVKAFNRRTFDVTGTVHTGAQPSALVYEPQSGLLFAICPNATIRGLHSRQAGSGRNGGSATGRGENHRNGAQQTAAARPTSVIIVINTQPLEKVAQILVSGTLGLVAADTRGQVYVTVKDRNEIARLDASSLRARLRWLLSGEEQTQASAQAAEQRPGDAWHVDEPLTLDWSRSAHPSPSDEGHMRLFPIGPGCVDPQGMAVDSNDMRLFAACRNMKLIVLNTGTGEIVASIPTGPGIDAVGYDQERGLIFLASGSGDGSLSILSQQVPDIYAVVQNLPTRRQARSLAVDPQTGAVYLVTEYLGLDLAASGGIGDMRSKPVEGSFQVLKIGN